MKLDLVGKRFGRLNVYREGSKAGAHREWWCNCDCGNITKVRQDNLCNGKTVSCGCRHEEVKTAYKARSYKPVATIGHWPKRKK